MTSVWNSDTVHDAAGVGDNLIWEDIDFDTRVPQMQ